MERLSDWCTTHWLSLLARCIDAAPFVLPSTATADWPARRDWVTADGRIDLDHLLRVYGQSGYGRLVRWQFRSGHLLVPVVEEGSSEPVEETLAEYIAYARGDRQQKRYLKDWHFQER